LGHLIFIFLHLIALLFGAVLLFVTIPLHLIYAAVRSRKRYVEIPTRKSTQPVVVWSQTPAGQAIEPSRSGPKAITPIPGTCRVVVEGSTLPGFAPDDVRRRLAALIGRSDDVAAKLLGGRPSVVKRGIDEAMGMRYVETLKKIGVACHLEQETLELDCESACNTDPLGVNFRVEI
jgi:hypothetical protein